MTNVTLRCARCGLEADVPRSLSRITIRDSDWTKCVCGVPGVIACPALNDAYHAIADAVFAERDGLAS